MHTAGRLVATHLPANTVKPRTAIFCSSVFMRVMSDVAVQCQSNHRYNDSKPPPSCVLLHCKPYPVLNS